LKIFPDPSDGNFTITFPGVIKDGSIEIDNILGTSIFSEPIQNVSRKEISLGKISQGTYFVKVAEGDKQVVRKVIVN
jgi:hypothetical protein